MVFLPCFCPEKLREKPRKPQGQSNRSGIQGAEEGDSRRRGVPSPSLSSVAHQEGQTSKEIFVACGHGYCTTTFAIGGFRSPAVPAAIHQPHLKGQWYLLYMFHLNVRSTERWVIYRLIWFSIWLTNGENPGSTNMHVYVVLNFFCYCLKIGNGRRGLSYVHPWKERNVG